VEAPGHAERVVGAEALAGGGRFSLDCRVRAAGSCDVWITDGPCCADLRDHENEERGKVTHRATVRVLWLTTDSLLSAERLAAEFKF
jgi:hypothetical protein